MASLRAAGCRVLLFTGFDPAVFPVIRMLRGKVAASNMHLRTIAAARQCDLVDLWSMRVLGDRRVGSADRLNLTAEGHRRYRPHGMPWLGRLWPARAVRLRG